LVVIGHFGFYHDGPALWLCDQDVWAPTLLKSLANKLRFNTPTPAKSLKDLGKGSVNRLFVRLARHCIPQQHCTRFKTNYRGNELGGYCIRLAKKPVSVPVCHQDWPPN
jgi:hypothetical protein